MRAKILMILVAIFPSYLCLYCDGFKSALSNLTTITVIAGVVSLIRILSMNEVNDTEENKKELENLIEMWICHLIGFAICIFVKSL